MILTDKEALKIKCSDVASLDEYFLIKSQLEKELLRSAEMGMPGIGLAAPQIGIPKNMAIIRLSNDSAYPLSVDLVNCKIKNKYDKSLFNGEGCLSFPGRYETTSRYKEIHIINNMVEPYEFIATGLFAVACQHELDHLSGILLPEIAISSIKSPEKKKIRPNDECPCGKINPNTQKIFKYKKCCGS